MRIAIAGLASSHPFTDARILAEHAELVVYDDEPGRIARFRDEHPDAAVVPDLAAALDLRPDGVVLTVPTRRLAPALDRVLARDLPCFVNKPAAATWEQLTALEQAVARSPERVLSSSVLRFAPDFTKFQIDPADVLSARVTVRHDVRQWSNGHNPWQDDPAEGGGMLVTMGVHGIELLVALLGNAVETVAATASVRRYTSLASEDTASLLLRWDSGITGAVTFLGATASESYEVVLHCVDRDERVVLSAGTDPQTSLGYHGTLGAFLSMVDGAPSPVPWAETRAVLSALVRAREVADGR